jgi:hypothetical protein
MAINKLLFIPQWHTTGTVSIPDANFKALYPKSGDSHWYFVDSDGSEKRIETGLDIRNGITTTTLATSSVFRARIDLSIGSGLTFSGNFAGSSVSVFGVTTDMLQSIGSATSGYVLTSNGASFNWVTPSSLVAGISGTTNKISKFTTPTTLGNSLITDDGVKVVIGVTPSFAVGLVNVDGDLYVSGDLFLTDNNNVYIRHSNGILVQSDENITFRDELAYNYLDMKTDNISSYTFSILNQTLLLGDNGSYSYLVANDINNVSFGSTLSTMTYSILSNTPGVLRIKDTSEGINKVFVSDSQGYGRWQNLSAGSGLTVSGLTYSIRLGGTGLTFSSGNLLFDYSILGSTLTQSSGTINLSNSGVLAGIYGTSNQLVSLTIDSYGRITQVNTFTFSGPTTSGISSADNGLSSIANVVILGGTLSQNTVINSGGYDLTIGADILTITGSVFDVEADGLISLDAGTGSVQILADDTITVSASSSIDLISTGSLNITKSNLISNNLLSLSYGVEEFMVLLSTDTTSSSYGAVAAGTFATIFVVNDGVNESRIDITSNASVLSNDGSTDSTILIQDQIANKGMVYVDDYSSNFTPYSLIHKQYLENYVSNNLIPTSYSKELISGGAIWNSGLTFDVSQLTYTFNGNIQTTNGATQVTFNVGDPTYSRIDALVVNDDLPYGLVSILQGVASPSPITPEIPSNELLVQYVILPSGATSLSFNQDFIYNENTEWVGSVYDLSGALGTFSFTSSNPTAFSGTYSLSGTGINRKRSTRFTRVSPILSSDYSSISFTVYYPAALPTSRFLTLRFLLGGVYIGNLVNVNPTFASGTVTGSWQQVVIPLYLFGLTGNIDGLEFQLAGSRDSDVRDFSIDYVQLQSGITPTYLSSSSGTLINSNSAGDGLTFSSASFGVNVNPDSLEITADYLRLKNSITGNRNFTGGVTISNNFSVTGSTTLVGLTASKGYISGTGSDILTLTSTGTGSTIFRVQGNSGELFSIVDGLTGSLFSVNDISGLPILEVFSDETILMGDYAAPSLNTTSKITSVTGSNTIYSIDKTLYTGAFFEYTVTKGTNARAGRIMSVWNGLTASYTENQTSDIGSTSDIVFVISATGSSAVLSASASSNNWIIKTIIRSI